ncbi:MAG: phenylalanine--tRNA ligase subunit beta [Pelosinus sp.]|nr:phenylalanine--tRNA ligase subunit beta [Pelosinus sp.]
MRASIKWLKEYVDFQEEPEVLAEKLTRAGIPVEGITYLGENIENVVTGKIVGIEPHPNADKLRICKLNTGKEELIIVTGAANVREGHIVPVALVGAKLPNGMKIKESKLRGEMSYGMLCSAAELNIDSKLVPPECRNGIYLLPTDTPLGVDIKPVLGLDDVVLEFELTANRADCFSVLGLAREIAVLTGGSVKKNMLNLREAGTEKAGSLASIVIEDQALCPRFAARVLKNIKVGPSPDWMKRYLEAAGMRSINNIVDVTNFVMLEMGQPMHAYDYNLVSKHKLIVRKARQGERLTTLDDVKRELTDEMIVIADEVQAIGIAGVMGGLATEVTDSTQNVLLEAASFHSARIRRTSRALGLRSEASGRFERGVDIVNITKALDRAAKLLEDMGACTVCPGVIDEYPGMVLPQQITFTAAEINAYLGTEISKQEMINILRSLEFELDTTDAEKIMVTVPTWRAGDVSRMADISEEIARIHGYDNISSTMPQGNTLRGRQSYMQTITDKVKDTLAGVGFDEIISYSFTHPATLDKLNIPADSKERSAIEVLNPITDDFPLLRTNLLGGVLETINRNLSRKNEDLKIYEIGRVYLPESLPLKELPEERLLLCGALFGRRQEMSWNTGRETVDFYDAKGAVENILEGLGVSDYQVARGEHHAMHPGKTAVITKGEAVLATIGEVHPKVLSAFDINRKVYVFELDMEVLAKEAQLIGTYQALPKFPAMTRDLALILPDTKDALAVMQAIKSKAGALLSEVRLFDVYTGGQIPEGFKSLAFSLVFRSHERTLTDEEVDAANKKVLAHLEKTFEAKLR